VIPSGPASAKLSAMTSWSGLYIALEGIEGAGKSTVARKVVDVLQASGRTALLVREPGGTDAGERIRNILLGVDSTLGAWAEALLFSAARSQLVVEVTGPALHEGTIVVSDRSVYSSLAYQGGGRGLGVEEVRSVNEPGLGGVWPDVVVLLRVDPTTGLDRQDGADRIGAEGADFQASVAATFDTLAAAEPERFIVVDASRPVDDVVEEILDRLALP